MSNIHFTDEVKDDLVRRYWAEIVPKFLNPVVDCDQMSIEYNKILPYLSEYILSIVIERAEECDSRFNPNKSSSGNSINFFMTISKRQTIFWVRKAKSFIIDGNGDLFFDRIYKGLKREYLIDHIISSESPKVYT